MKTEHPQIVDAEDMSGHWPRDVAGLAAPLSQTDAWKRLRKKFPKKKFDFDASVPGLRVALANLPKEPDSLDVESGAALVHASEWAWLNPDEGVEYLCVRMSPLDVLKALLLATTYRGAGHEAHRVEISEKRGSMTARTFPYWKALLRASDEEQKEARAFAEARWSDASVNEKGTLLACFPDRAEWALAHSEEPSEHIDFVLLATLRDAEALRKVEYFGPQQVNAVENLAPDEAAAYFDDCFARAKDESAEKPTTNALARICTPGAAAVFVKHMRKKVIQACAVAYFTAHPELAAGALGELAKKKTKLAATAREILERAERSDVSASSAVDNKEAPGEAPEAKLSEVPEVLREARWPKKRKASKTKPLEGLAIPTEPCRMHWPLLSRQRHLIDRLSWAQKDERAVSQHVGQPLARIKEAAADPDSEGDWNLDGILAKYGDEAAHAVASVIQQKRGSFSFVRREVLESPAIATRLDREGSIWRWMRRYPEAAVAGLVPATLMAEGKLRAAGEARLRWMQLLGHGEAIRQAADGHGDTARSTIDVILAADPYDEVPAKAPKMGKSYRPAELRAPVLKSGKRLPLAAVERLCEMLAFSETTPAYIGIQDVREACTASSLSDFAWDLAKGWSLGGHKSNELWMLHAIEHYGDDEAVRRLTPELKGSGIASMLEDVATDAALMELGNIKMHCASLTRPPKYAEGHEEAIAYIALQRGVTIDELEEEYVPTVGGLDETGAVTLDLGPTKVRVTFDATLLPLLHDEDGERLKALPRGKKSDPAKLKIAKSALKELEQDATVIGRQRIESLRRALVQQRSWSKERFARLFVRHPLMRYMTRALIWQAVDGAAFRVAEDGTFADLDESELTLPDTTHVRLCHPLSLSAKERAAWGEILADYDLIQPIEQLSMDVSFPDVGDAIELTYEGVSYETMPDPKIVMPSLGWTTTSQHNGIAIGDHIVILYVRHPKLIVRVLNMELKQIPIKDVEPRARIVVARACDALMTKS